MSELLDAALAYIRQGFAPVPIPHRQKCPRGNAWQTLRITAEDAPRYFNGAPQNIGIILGPASAGLTDVDLDCREALAVAPDLLPATPAIFGRKSKRCSHLLFTTDLHETIDKATIQFQDPNKQKAENGAANDDKITLLELRIGGGGRAAQTVFPPSTHKDTGELIEWERDCDGEPASISGAALLKAAKETAAACLFARYWPRVGGRHDAALVLGGFLARAGMDIPHIKVFSEAVARAADADVAHTVRCAADSAKAHADGQAVFGLPAAIEVFGEKTGRKCAEWLGYKGESHAGVQGAGADPETGKIVTGAIRPDAEAGPVMILLDGILCASSAAEPPMRNVEGWPVEIQCRETAGLHELSPEGANDKEDNKSRLPPPKNFLLTKHDKESLEILIGDLITFMQKGKKGDERPVAPPAKFIAHYLKYRRSNLPRVHAVLTMPLVLPDGTPLARNGLDRERRAVFRIDPALMPFIPKTEDCTPDTVAAAFKFLTDEWLCDVATDPEGKCVLIALALSIIERILLPTRPLFFVTAGLRGGGKTTSLMMVSIAATGIKVAAAAWPTDRDERKKAIFSYLLEALPFLVWDNIPRGAMIGCPHLERASTSETYSDRVLGETRTAVAPAYTIHAFTGNNIAPKSDQASRSLEARITTDSVDPENRVFKHQDPIGWTQDHRGEILHALYTVLLGNPQLKARRPAETRFKEWWHLIGSAVEHAALRADQTISFKQMFARCEAKDEEAIERAGIAQTLHAMFGDEEFTATELNERLVVSAFRDFGAADEDADVSELRRFCTARLAKVPSPKSISHNLQTIADAPVAVLGGTASLRSFVNPRDKQRRFFVELKKSQNA